MTYWLSKPIEELVKDNFTDSRISDENPKLVATSVEIDTLIVGSGYGAAMAAIAIAEHYAANENLPDPNQIFVLERGDEYAPSDFPKSIDDLPGYTSVTSHERNKEQDKETFDLGNAGVDETALWDIRVGERISSVAGNGLGGTSLVNASVALRPEEDTLNTWPAPAASSASWFSELDPVFGLVEKLLSVNNWGAKADKGSAMHKLAKALGAGKNDIKTAPLTVIPGICNENGNCVIGCHSGAKKSLNLNIWPMLRSLDVEHIYTGASVDTVELEELEDQEKDKSWRVSAHFSRSTSKQFSLKAKRVILAAGTIGSTEILARSRDKKQLSLSNCLGKRFSGNGDALIFGVGQEDEVNAVAKRASYAEDNDPHGHFKLPGPTITSTAKIDLAKQVDWATNKLSDTHITLEDGAIPYPLAKIWQEMIVTQSFLRRYTKSEPSIWHQEHEDHDYLAVSDELAKHSQVLLAMGHDGANGQLRAHSNNGRITPYWPENKSRQSYYDVLHESLKKVESTGFDGGEYHPNPAWKPLPEGFDGVLEGSDKVNEHIITVHPLGGCSMGEDSSTGVINTKGQVFQNSTNSPDAYENLYVLDGAAIPGSLGKNPFLTIAALSFYLARGAVNADVGSSAFYNTLAETQEIAKKFMEPPCDVFGQTDYVNKLPDLNAECIQGKFEETFFYRFPDKLFSTALKQRKLLTYLRKQNEKECDALANTLKIPEEPRKLLYDDFVKNDYFKKLSTLEQQKLYKYLRKLKEKRGIENWNIDSLKALVLTVEFFFKRGNEETRINGSTDLNAWIQSPDQPLTARAKLYLHGRIHHTVPAIHLQHATPIAFFKGEINLGKRDLPKSLSSLVFRVIGALLRFAYYRPTEVIAILLSALHAILPGKAKKNKTGLLSRMKAFARVARLHADWREMRYEFDEISSNDDYIKIAEGANPDKNENGIHISGKKRLRYALFSDDIWTALFNLPGKISLAGTRKYRSSFIVDPLRMTKGPSPFQVTNNASLPNLLMAMTSTGAFFLRSIMQTHFWSFGAPDYDRYQDKTEGDNDRLTPMPEILEYRDQNNNRCYSLKREDFFSPEHLCRLTRYQPEGKSADRKTVLLVHGLAHSSRIFWTDTIDVNMAQYFLRENYDVWIIDHRTSASFIEEVNPEHTWDDIALVDIPWAVKTVYDTINKSEQTSSTRTKRVHVFAHCIGAGAVSIALLAGELKKDKKDMLASLVPHAVEPWLVASSDNRLRENIWNIFKDRDLINTVEPMPHNDPDFIETIYDRIASSTISKKLRKNWGLRNNLGWGYFDPRGPGFPRTTYTRYSIFWGQQWFDKNITRQTRKKFAGMIGAVPVAVLQQVYFSITRGRLSNNNGENAYVNDKNLKNWLELPTLFIHGTENKVFDIESSRLSAALLTMYRKYKPGSSIRRKGTYQFDENNTIEPEDYLDNNVDIRIVDSYGHMDMVFGEHASEHIFPELDKFFTQAEIIAESLYSARPRVSLSDFEDNWNNNKPRLEGTEYQPIGHVVPHTGFNTGPTINIVQPKVESPTINQIRIWLEEEDFATTRMAELKAKLICKEKSERLAIEEVDPIKAVESAKDYHVNFRVFNLGDMAKQHKHCKDCDGCTIQLGKEITQISETQPERSRI